MHISRTLAVAYLQGKVSRRFLREAGEEHLGTLCPACAEGLAVLAAGADAARDEPDPVGDPVEAVGRRLRMSELRLRGEVRKAQGWLKRFLGKVPANERCGVVRGAYKRYRGQVFGTLLLEEARRAMPDDPAESLSLAEAVLVSCKQTHPDDPDPLVRVPALAVRANAKRALGRFREAEADLEEAARLLDRSDLDDLAIAAEIERFCGSLEHDLGRHDLAIRHLERAATLYPLLGDHAKTAATLVKLGMVHRRIHRNDAAIEETRKALELLDPDGDPQLRGYAHYNLALYFHSQGDIDRAEKELDAHRGLIAASGESLVFRAGWLRARIAWSRGEVERAERRFADVYRKAQDRGIPFDTGFVGLELALVHLAGGRAAEASALAVEALGIFAEQEVERETQAALEVLEAALRRGAVTREQVESAVRLLDRGGCATS